ncbi:OsmC family protein [Paenibacillus algorifonticola]|uniref:Peroxiredoxin n=2 Tax=Paenibacillus TaxID=44249 RepID=A0A1B2DH06_9BACL|nr:MULTISPECIES: OsmC family protein [Paenibacillus]ANY67002.1 peroxiredoxin [Paenibacillus sp. BIHB 4019]KQO11035.1 peroxiredoxin [Paenibacillus sp. Leaf72]SFF46437.1 putative redox protein [Paenibacillus algorifonticola]
MKVTTTWTGKRAFTSVGPSGYSVGMDATAAYGGDGQGATPMELLLAGLAGCIGIDITMIMDAFLGSITSIEIDAEGTRKEEMPKGFTAIDLIFKVNGDVPDYRIWKAIELGKEKYCAVSDSLKADIRYRLVLNGVEMTRG